MNNNMRHLKSGFTLVEVIIIIVALAVLGAMMIAFFGTSLTQSGTAFFNLSKSRKLNEVMEKISAKYAEIPRWRKVTVFPAGTVVLSTAAAANQGKFLSSGGTSGTTEPSWNNLSVGAETTDGSITWAYEGTPPELTDLQTSIGAEGQNFDNGFGKYRTIHNHFVKFNESTKEEEPCDSLAACTKYGVYLKVTIGFSTDDPEKTGETLTALFVRR